MNSDRISVVFFRTAYGTMGGGTKMLLRLLRGLNKNHFEITLVSQYEDELCKRVSDLDIETEIIPYPGVLNTYDGGLLELPIHKKALATVGLFQYSRRFKNRVETPKVLWCAGTRPFMNLFPYIRQTEAVTIWNVGLMTESSGWMKWVNSLCLRYADHVFIESEVQAKRQLTEKQYMKYADKFTIFHKGINTRNFDPGKFEQQDHDGYRVGTAALINPRKGLEYFIDAAAKVIEDRSDVHFTIAGEPAREDDKLYKQELNDRILEHGIADHIEFLGWVDDMPAYLNTLDVFVLPSYNEGIPGAIREALAMEVPVVATDIGGTSEAVIDGKTGYLVEPEDAEQIAMRIDQLLNDQSMRAEFGKQGRKHMVENFSIESYVRNYEEFLEDISQTNRKIGR